MIIGDDFYDDFVMNGEFEVFVDDEQAYYYASYTLPYTIKLVAIGGRAFTTAQSNHYDVVEGEYPAFTINPPDVATKTFDSSTGEFDYLDWTFATQEVAEPEPEPSEFDFTVTQSFIDELASKRITLYINENLAVDGDEYDMPYDVRLEVDSTHYATEYRSWYYDTVEGDYFRLTPSNDFKTLTGTITFLVSNIDTFVIETELDESAVVPEKVAYNDVFVLTPEQAREIATTQFSYYQTNSGTQGGGTLKPQGENVISFIDLPFNIDPSLIQGAKTIKVGVIDTDITADYLNIDSYLLDLGNITVPDDKENYLSFDNTTAILHLPYANPINIDIDYVIGQTINITYNVNFYDGIASVNITSSKINGVIDTKSIKLNINIPFGKPDDNPSDNSPRNIDFGIDNGVLRPYVEILRNDAVLSDGFFTVPVPDESLLSNQIGYVTVDEIDLKVTASKDEKEMILRVLDSGVIIK